MAGDLATGRKAGFESVILGPKRTRPVTSPERDATQSLAAYSRGDRKAADDLLPLVYAKTQEGMACS